MCIPHYVPLIPQGKFGSDDTYFGSEDVRWYAEPGTPVKLKLRRNSTTGSAFIEATVSGYLVNVP